MKEYNINFSAWLVYSSGDGVTEEIECYCSSESLAAQIISSKGESAPWYRKRYVTIKHNYTVVESTKELADLHVENVRKSALKKLTDEERQVLGL